MPPPLWKTCSASPTAPSPRTACTARSTACVKAKEPIENDLKERYGVLFGIDYDLLLYDLTSTYFEGLAEENDLARRGYSRDHRSDCQAGRPGPGRDPRGLSAGPLHTGGQHPGPADRREHRPRRSKHRFGRAQGVWVMDRGMISKDTVSFLSRPGRRYVLATRRSELKRFAEQLRGDGWQRLAEHPEVEVKLVKRRRVYYLLARSTPRRQKERAIRRRQRRGLPSVPCSNCNGTIAAGRLKKRDKILERLGRLKERYPKAVPFVTFTVSAEPRPQLQWTWNVAKFRDALARDGAYLLRSNQSGWSPTEFWETYMQLTVVERAFRVLKSELLLRPIWHHYSGRTEAHVFICVLAYALWKTLDHLAKQAGLMTEIRKPDPHPAQRVAQGAADDARGHPPRTGPDPDRRHPAGNDRRASNWRCAAWPGPMPSRPRSWPP